MEVIKESLLTALVGTTGATIALILFNLLRR